MNRKLIKVVMGMLIMSTLLVQGCSPRETVKSQDAMDLSEVFVEESMDLSELDGEFILDMLKTGDGKVEIYTQGEMINLYTVDEKGHLVKEALAWQEQIAALGDGIITALTKNNEGTVYAAYLVYEDENYEHSKTEVLKINNDEIEVLDIAVEEDVYISKMDITDTQQLLLLNNYVGIAQYNLNDNSFVRQYSEGTIDFILKDNKIYELNIDESAIEVCDVMSGSSEKLIPVTIEDGEGVLYLDEDKGHIYIANKEGIRKLSEDEKRWSTVFVGGTFEKPSVNSSRGIYSHNSFYHIFMNNTGQQEFMKYTLVTDNQMGTNEKVQFSIYMLRECPTIRQAALEYQEKHPEVKINCEVGMSSSNSAGVSEVIRALNAQLLAGEGPDLLVLDGLPTESYIQKGLLRDISSCVQASIQENESLANIIDIYKADNKNYVVPMRFTIPTLWGDKEVISSNKTLDDLVDYMKQNKQKTIISYKTPEELINEFYTTCSTNWFNSEGELQEGNLKAFLENIKALAYQGQDDFNNLPITAQGILGLQADDAIKVAYNQLEIQSLRPITTSDILCAAATSKQKGNYELTTLVGESSNIFEPIGLVGVSINSKQTEIAEAIIRQALSSEVQSIDTKDGLPVNKTALRAWFDTKKHENIAFALTGSDANGISREMEITWADEAVINKFISLCEQAETPMTIDQDIIQIIINESEDYFEGKSSLDDVVDIIKRKTELYLVER